ncbi:MAG: patatin-like phospholipase family protein [Solirubrobacteraceae bacterium]|nr:patatin-like phospholipase family protein [Solirubrobacteraceae bacterium]
MAAARIYTAPADPATEGFADLVLAGGGMKGVAYVGVLEALHRRGYRTHPRVAGTSVGALVGSVIATGASPERVRELMLAMPFALMKDRGGDRLPIAGAIKSLWLDGGRYVTDALLDWIDDNVPELHGLTFGELRRTRADEMAARGVDWNPALDPLVILATDVTRGELVRFPADFARYAGTSGAARDPDDALVLDAVRASISVPLYFEPTRIGASEFVDGGVLANYAVDAFDRPDAPLQPRWPTFGFTLTAHDDAHQLGDELFDAISPLPVGPLLAHGGRVASALIGTLIAGQDRENARRWWMAHRTVEIDTSGTGIVEFDLSDERREAVVERGRAATAAFLDGPWQDGADRAGWGFDGRARYKLPAAR